MVTYLSGRDSHTELKVKCARLGGGGGAGTITQSGGKLWHGKREV